MNYVLLTSTARTGLSRESAERLQKQFGGVIISTETYLTLLETNILIGQRIDYKLGEHLGNKTGSGIVVEITDDDIQIVEDGEYKRVYYDEII